jgi:hypothetical protein
VLDCFLLVLHVHWVCFVVAKNRKHWDVEFRAQGGHSVDEEVGVALLCRGPHTVVDNVTRENHVSNVL